MRDRSARQDLHSAKWKGVRRAVRFFVNFAIVPVAGAWAAIPSFQHEILPVLERRCIACHGSGQPMGGLHLLTLTGVMAGGTNGAVVIPGNPGGSRLWVLVRDGKMPMGGSPLSDGEKQLIREWIEKGQFPSVSGALAEKRKEKINDKARQWWSYKRPVKPTLPTVGDASRVRGPIDAFIEAKLEEKKWTIGPEADKTTLARRAYFDLLGLPPTPEQVREFLADSNPGAYERLIDRLLESPHYGERWGRHWLDVAGYADSIGNFTDEVRTYAWRYRDYVIRAFNQDKPYNQFLLEQFAGDQLVNYDPQGRPRPEDIEKLTATGFLRMPADFSDQQPIHQVDKYYDALQSTVETSLSAVMGIGFQCARCHDHKFDPILQEDYYKLMAAYQPALDPEKWIAATMESGFFGGSNGTWPSRHIIDVDPGERDAWIKSAIEEYSKLSRARRAMVAALAKYRKDKGASSADAGAADGAGEAITDQIPPELAQQAAALREREAAYKAVNEKRIWALWDVSKNPSQTHILVRGNYLSPGDGVDPGVPAILDDPQKPFRFPNPKPEWHHTGRRLALAEWLTQPDHPLTARVVVNRVWQYHFGEGIVRTPDDFGSQGVPPTHPDLLDWMATSFVENGWSMKWLHRQIMLSSAYRQSSAEDPVKVATDPSDKLVWRKAPLRFEAEVIRDSILQVSGQLDETLFGEPIPVIKGPDGQYLVDDSRKDSRRRSLYLLARKTTPHGFLLAFDEPTMDAGNMTMRFRSALPIQALAMTNSSFVIKSAKVFAARIEREAGKSFDDRVRRAYELAYSRAPRPEELQEIHTALEGEDAEAAWRVFCQALFASNEFLYSY